VPARWVPVPAYTLRCDELTPRFVGFALAVAPTIWEGFSETDRANVESWLGNSINQKK
jgi:hypothetical protein